jgi:hypothetical protein
VLQPRKAWRLSESAGKVAEKLRVEHGRGADASARWHKGKSQDLWSRAHLRGSAKAVEGQSGWSALMRRRTRSSSLPVKCSALVEPVLRPQSF